MNALATNPTSVSDSFFKKLEKVADLDYYEGPLVSLFFNPSSYRLYIYEWYDNDTSHNRWLIYETSFTALQSLIKDEIGHRDFLLSARGHIYYLADIRFTESTLYYDKIAQITKEELPEAYLPHPDARFPFFQNTPKDQPLVFLATYESNLQLEIEAKLKAHDLRQAAELLMTLKYVDFAAYKNYFRLMIDLLSLLIKDIDNTGKEDQLLEALSA